MPMLSLPPGKTSKLIFMPKPRNASFNLDPKKIQLSWIPSRNSESFDIYFWKSKFPQALKQGQKLKNGKAAVGKPIFVKNQKERYWVRIYKIYKKEKIYLFR